MSEEPEAPTEVVHVDLSDCHCLHCMIVQIIMLFRQTHEVNQNDLASALAMVVRDGLADQGHPAGKNARLLKAIVGAFAHFVPELEVKVRDGYVDPGPRKDAGVTH